MSSENVLTNYPQIFSKDGQRIYRIGESASGYPKRIEVQDYKTIRNKCLAEGILFEDNVFPTYKIRINKENDEEVQWKRPKEIVPSPKIYAGSYSRFDIIQGNIGDCWFLGIVNILAQNKKVLSKVIPGGQSFTKNYAGIFRFRFWQYGKWVEVVIDDRLPTSKGMLHFARSGRKDVFWSALLEKAYAKLHGSYYNLNGGLPSEALIDFTGGLCETFKFKSLPDNFFSTLLQSFQRQSLISASHAGGFINYLDDYLIDEVNLLNENKIITVNNKNESNEDDVNAVEDDDVEEDDVEVEIERIHDTDHITNIKHHSRVNEKGLVEWHIYAITHVCYLFREKLGKQEKVPLLRLLNPWGGKTEFIGKWSDNSPEWDTVSQLEKENINFHAREEGEFWMEYDEFIENVYNVNICHWDFGNVIGPEMVISKENKKVLKDKSWEVRVFEGQWITDEHGENVEKYLARSPQYRLELVDPDEEDDDHLCTLIVGLQSKYLRLKDDRFFLFDFELYQIKSDEPSPLLESFFLANKPIDRKINYMSSREYTIRFKLPPGNYCIIPKAMQSGAVGEFYLRVITE